MIDEVSLKEYIDIRVRNVEDKLDVQAKFVAQHFALNEMAIKKAEEGMLDRLEQMNEFREQIKEERTSYATKIELASAVKERDLKIAMLTSANAFSAGKTWMIMAMFAAIPTIIALIALFIRS